MFSFNKWTHISPFFICVKTTIHDGMFDDAHAFNGGLSGWDVASNKLTTLNKFKLDSTYDSLLRMPKHNPCNVNFC